MTKLIRPIEFISMTFATLFMTSVGMMFN